MRGAEDAVTTEQVCTTRPDGPCNILQHSREGGGIGTCCSAKVETLLCWQCSGLMPSSPDIRKSVCVCLLTYKRGLQSLSRAFFQARDQITRSLLK